MNAPIGLRSVGLQFSWKNMYPSTMGPFSGHFPPGCHAVVAPTTHHADLFVAACAGLVLPSRGQILIEGKDPARDPGLRESVATLFCEEPELIANDLAATPSGVVGETITRLAQQMWGQKHDRSLLSLETQLAPIWSRTLASLTLLERRRVMVQIALRHPQPRVLVLYEPWTALVPPEDGSVFSLLLDHIKEAETQGAVVLLVTVSTHLAHMLTPSVKHLWKERTARENAW